jgi:hypothetical protein
MTPQKNKFLASGLKESPSDEYQEPSNYPVGIEKPIFNEFKLT